MTRSAGAARAVLLVLLGTAITVTVAGVWFVMSSDSPGAGGDGSDESGGDDETGPVPLGSGAPQGSHRPRRGTGTFVEEPDDESGADVESQIGDRDPEGEIFVVDDSTLRALFKGRHDDNWEEFRRQIDVFESEKKPLPADVVQGLLAMLKDDSTRLDAVLALGQVKNDTSVGLALAQLAADDSADADTRVAALKTLALSGQPVGLEIVRPLVEGGESPVTRQAFFALAAMGNDAVPVLLSSLAAHNDDALTDAVLTALAKSKGSDAALANEFRTARDGANGEKLEQILRVGSQMAKTGGPELRAEVKKIVDAGKPPSIEGVDDATSGRIFSSALSVAAGFGGEPYKSVIRVAMNGSGADKDMAQYALRQGSGDEQADALNEMVTPEWFASQPPHSRWEMANAFGATRSPRAAPRLVRMLDDEDTNVRNAAAQGLGQTGDMESSKPLLDKLEKSLADFDFSRTLVQAIGKTLDKTALPRLQKIVEKEFANSEYLMPYLRQAIYRIQSGNADATLMSSPK